MVSRRGKRERGGGGGELTASTDEAARRRTVRVEVNIAGMDKFEGFGVGRVGKEGRKEGRERCCWVETAKRAQNETKSTRERGGRERAPRLPFLSWGDQRKSNPVLVTRERVISRHRKKEELSRKRAHPNTFVSLDHRRRSLFFLTQRAEREHKNLSRYQRNTTLKEKNETLTTTRRKISPSKLELKPPTQRRASMPSSSSPDSLTPFSTQRTSRERGR